MSSAMGDFADDNRRQTERNQVYLNCRGAKDEADVSSDNRRSKQEQSQACLLCLALLPEGQNVEEEAPFWAQSYEFFLKYQQLTC